MSEITDLTLTEKYRPQTLDDIIFEDKECLIKYLQEPSKIPSMIFHSVSPGTGKSSLAQIIAKYLKCDVRHINASDERGIDIIRENIKYFVESMSSIKGIKKLVILEEADGLTTMAQKSLKDPIEKYSDNAFFIFTCNDVSKIIKEIQSRCVIFNFLPPKKKIFDRLLYIAIQEKIDIDPELVASIIDIHYPDIRPMILSLQEIAGGESRIEKNIDNKFELILGALKHKNSEEIYTIAFSRDFNILHCNKKLFHYVFEHYQEFNFEKTSKITEKLAEVEKSWNLGVNLPIIFVANMLQIMKYF